MIQEKIYSQIRREFQENFFKLIKPSIKNFEKERIQNIVVSCIITILLLIFSFATVVFSIELNAGEKIKEFIGIIGIALAFLAFYIIPETTKSFENSVKRRIMPLVCSCFENIKWKLGHYYDDRLFFNSNLLVDYPKWTAKYDDMFVGTHKDVYFEIAELFWQKDFLTLIKQHAGVIIKIKMNKNFTGNTIIESKKLLKRSRIMGFMFYDYLNLYSNRRLGLTKLEDIEFNKKYDVYTNDEVEARYLITPAFMQRLKDMKIAFKTDNIRCSFYNGYILIGLFTKKDLFSIGSLFKSVGDTKQFFKMFEELLSIVKLIDHFKLNQKIGL